VTQTSITPEHTEWLEQLWADHHTYLRNHLTSRTKDGHLAEDLTSETFLRILTTAGRYTNDNPRGLLVRIGTRLFLDHIKSTAYRHEEPAGDPPDGCDLGVDPAVIIEHAMTAAERGEQLQQVLRAVDSLTAARQRDVIRLDLAEATTEESCAALGTNPNALKVARHYAITKLRAAISGQTTMNAPRGTRHNTQTKGAA